MPHNKAKHILFHEINGFTLLVAILHVLLGYSVYHFTISPRLPKWCRPICRHYFSPLSFDICKNLSASDLEADTSNFVTSVLTAICGQAINFPLYLFSSNDAQKFASSYFHQLVHKETTTALTCATWIKHSTLQGNWGLWFPQSISNRATFVHACPHLQNRCPRVATWLAYAWKTIHLSGAVAFKKLKTRYGSKTIHSEHARSSEHFSQKVLYFPHQGIYFGKLFRKDVYYNSDPRNPLHPSNILHIEIDRETLDSEDWMATLTYLRTHDSTHTLIPRPGANDLIHTLLSIPKRSLIGLLAHILRNNHHGKIYAATRFLAFYTQFLYWKKALTPMREAKVALVGYEVLFPKPLSLAMKELGIHTFSTQERMHMTFHNQANTCVDTYFTASDFVSDIWKRKKYSHISTLTSTGLYRTDRLKKYHIPNFADRTVVVFDFHSLKDRNAADRLFNATWHSNRSFYLDILKLAQIHSTFQFIIRGKFACWTEIPFFKETYKSMTACPNITIHTKFDELDASYKDAANARLIISRPSSIAEECMAVGIPVIIHDYMPHMPRYFSPIMNLGHLEPYVHDFEELAAKCQIILSGKAHKSPEAEADRQRIFGQYDDTPVQQKIQQHILTHLKQACTSNEAPFE